MQKWNGTGRGAGEETEGNRIEAGTPSAGKEKGAGGRRKPPRGRRNEIDIPRKKD